MIQGRGHLGLGAALTLGLATACQSEGELPRPRLEARVSTSTGWIRPSTDSQYHPGPHGPLAPQDYDYAPPELRQGPFHRFTSERIYHDDGTVTALMFFRAGQGARFQKLITEAVPGARDLGEAMTVEVNFVTDPRPPNLGAYTGKQGIPQGIGNVADLMSIRASEDLIDEIDYFLSRFFDMPQIEVEARVVEITSNDRLEWGVNASVTTENPEEPVRTFFRDSTLSLGNDNAADASLNFSGIHDEATYQLLLDFIASKTDSDILSMPKMVVLNGHQGVIDTGQLTPFLTPGKVGATGDITGGTIEFKPTGVRLIVTPFIVHDDVIDIDVGMEVSSVTGLITVGSVQGVAIQNPEISKRSAQTLVRIQEGQTIAIGGLLTRAQIDDVVKVPILGDIPILGYLFKKRTKSTTRSEVVFFITPRIVTQDDAIFDPLRQ